MTFRLISHHLEIRLKISDRDRKIASDGNWAAVRFAMILRSRDPAILCRFCRKYSRMHLLTRLRTTAPPTLLETVTPSLCRQAPFGASTAIKCRFCIRLPDSDRLRNRERFNSLSALGNENGRSAGFIDDLSGNWLRPTTVFFPWLCAG